LVPMIMRETEMSPMVVLGKVVMGASWDGLSFSD